MSRVAGLNRDGGNWFEPIEAVFRDRAREFLQATLEGERRLRILNVIILAVGLAACGEAQPGPMREAKSVLRGQLVHLVPLVRQRRRGRRRRFEWSARIAMRRVAPRNVTTTKLC